MPVNAVQKNDASKSGILSYPFAAAAGGLTGYALKYAIPLNKSEKNDGNYKIELENIKSEAEELKKSEIESIRKIAKKTLAQDTFVKLADDKKLNVVEINKLNYTISGDVMDLYTTMTEKADYLLSRKEKSLKAYTKRIRPASTFVIIGVAAATIGALVNNLFKSKNKN